MTRDCDHALCAIIGGTCSLATRRSRGCRPNLAAKDVAPELLDEVRRLVGALAAGVPTDEVRAAAVRLAAIVRKEALEDRNLLAVVSADDPALAPALARLVRRPART